MQLTLNLSISTTPSPGSVAGRLLWTWPGGLLVFLFGPRPVLVSLSRWRDTDGVWKTTVTCGQFFGPSLPSACLQSSLASRLRARLDGLGSTLYRYRWKTWVTPSGRQISALRASALRTSGSDSSSARSGWPTAKASDAPRGGCIKRGMRTDRSNLVDRAMIAGWPTTVSNDARGSAYAYSRGNHDKKVLKLLGVARLAGWGTPTANEPGGTAEQALERKRRARENGSRIGVSVTALSHQAQSAGSGQTPSGSPVGTGSTGQLNPAFTRWLQGFPAGWDDCAPQETRSSHRSRPSS